MPSLPSGGFEEEESNEELGEEASIFRVRRRFVVVPTRRRRHDIATPPPSPPAADIKKGASCGSTAQSMLVQNVATGCVADSSNTFGLKTATGTVLQLVETFTFNPRPASCMYSHPPDPCQQATIYQVVVDESRAAGVRTRRRRRSCTGDADGQQAGTRSTALHGTPTASKSTGSITSAIRRRFQVKTQKPGVAEAAACPHCRTLPGVFAAAQAAGIPAACFTATRRRRRSSKEE